MSEISVLSAKRANEPELCDTSRLEMFSDGAFAIIITLLVLEIHRPNAAQGALAKDLLDEWPSYLAYALAFIYVGIIWFNHHYLFDLQRADAGMMSAAWLPVFYHIHCNPKLVKESVSAGTFAVQLRRPVLGILFYVIAAILGWFVHPFAAVIIFSSVVAYYAWTSQGIRSDRMRRFQP
jgi:uncharacterized membrane protein